MLPLSLEQAAIMRPYMLRHYQLPLRMRVTATVDRAALVRALGMVVDRHEPLRLRLAAAPDGTAQQRIEPPGQPYPLTVTVAPPGVDVEGLVDDVVSAPLDLYGAGPLRATLVRRDDGGHDLLLLVHHLATDNWSQDILAAELAMAYEAVLAGAPPALPPLRASWTQHVLAQAGAGTELSAAQWGHWSTVVPASSSLVTPGAAEPGSRSSAAEAAQLSATDLPPDARTVVDRFARATRVTPASAWQTLLLLGMAHAFESDDFLYLHMHHGREVPGSRALVGFFARTIVLRFQTSGRDDLAQLCRATMRSVLDGVQASRPPYTIGRLESRLDARLFGPGGRLTRPLSTVTLNVSLVPAQPPEPEREPALAPAFHPSPFGVRTGRLSFFVDVGDGVDMRAAFDRRAFPEDLVAAVFARVAKLVQDLAVPPDSGRLTADSYDRSGPRASSGGPDQSPLRPRAADVYDC